MTHVYTRERHENKNTRFWATMVYLPETCVCACIKTTELYYITINITIYYSNI